MPSPSKPLKVALLGPLPPTIGGIATHMHNLLEGPLGSRVRFVPVETMSRKHGQAGYERESILGKVGQILRDAATLIGVLVRCKPDLVHINSSFNSGAFWRDALFTLIVRLWRRPVFLQFHGGSLDEFRALYPAWVWPLIHGVLRRAARIAVLSQAQAAPLRETDLADRTRIIPNMIDTSAFEESKSDGPFTFLVIASHFTIEKGVYDVVNAFTQMEEAGRNCRLVLIGSGAEEENLKALCRKHDLEDRVVFTGFLTKDEVRAWLAKTHVFVLPSHSEGFPMVVMEAMASSLAVVSTRVGAIPDLIDEGVNGFVVKVGDVASLADRMATLYLHESLRLDMGQANRTLMHDHYDVRRVSERFYQLYQEIAG